METKEKYEVAVRVPQMVMTTQDYAERRREFDKFVSSQMKQDVDYGTIPGTKKPTLYKPGAEKISRMYGVRPRFSVEWQESDPATGYFTIKYRCQLVLVGTDSVMAEGLGLCSSFEKKYRWRKQWWNSPGRPPDVENWQMTKGKKYFRNVPNPDLIDTWNTVDKMSQKRSMVAANLCISGASERFTQDMEDFMDREPPTQRRGPQKKANGDPPRPWKPELLKKKLIIAVSKKSGATGKPSQGQIGLLAGKLEEAWPGDKGAADNRHEVLGWLAGKRSAKDLSLAWTNTLLNWLLASDGDTFNEHSREEARLIHKQAMLDQGQQELPIDEAAKTPEQHQQELIGNVEGRN